MNHLLFEISCFVTTIDINKESDKCAFASCGKVFHNIQGSTMLNTNDNEQENVVIHFY